MCLHGAEFVLHVTCQGVSHFTFKNLLSCISVITESLTVLSTT